MTCTTTLILFGLTNALHFTTGIAAMFLNCVFPITLVQAMLLGSSFIPIFLIIHQQDSLWKKSLTSCASCCVVFLAAFGIAQSAFDPLVFVAFFHGFATPCCVISLLH